MNDEEKKAIEIVKEIKNIKFKVTSSFYSSGTISLNIEEKEAIDTVLNLITKLQKENEEKDKRIDLILNFFADHDLGHYKKENGGEIMGQFRCYNKYDWKEHFEKLAKENRTKKKRRWEYTPNRLKEKGE